MHKRQAFQATVFQAGIGLPSLHTVCMHGYRCGGSRGMECTFIAVIIRTDVPV